MATTTLNAVPGHNPVDGVTEYVTLYVVFVGFSTVPNMLALAVVWLSPPDIDALPYDGTPHVYCVPVGTKPSVPWVGVITNDVPVQVVRLIVLISGLGLTYTVTVNALPELLTPEQVPNDGVTRYTAVCATFVLFVNVPVILLVPVPATPPVSDEDEGVGIPHV
jgi:hypothetical protein